MRLGRIGRGQFVHPLPEGRTCSSRSCFTLDRWLSNMSLKFLSHRDLLACFEVSLVESQLNLLQWSYFAHVPLAIRISFLACFRFFYIHVFCTCFCFIFPFSAPLLIWNVIFQHLLLASLCQASDALPAWLKVVCKFPNISEIPISWQSLRIKKGVGQFLEWVLLNVYFCW